MNAHTPPPRSDHATNVSVDPALLEQARTLGVDIDRACERGLAAQIDKARREQQWLAENVGALAAANAYVRDHGLPLAKYRLF